MKPRVWIPILVAGMLPLGAGSYAVAGDDSYCLVNVAEKPGTDVKNLRAQIIIDAPPHWVWQALTNYGDLKDLLPGYEKSNLIATAAGKQLDIAMKVAPLLPTYKYRVRINENRPGYRVHFSRVSGDFKSMEATYHLSSQAGGKRTLLTYDLALDTGFRMPGSQALLKSSAEKTMQALEQHAEKTYYKSIVGKR